MSRDTLSDLLRSVRLRGAVFFYISFRDQWSAEGLPAKQIAGGVMPGCEHVMEYHLLAKGSGWAAVSGLPPDGIREPGVLTPIADADAILGVGSLAAICARSIRSLRRSPGFCICRHRAPAIGLPA